VDFNDFTDFSTRRRSLNRESSVHMSRDQGDRDSPENTSEAAADVEVESWTARRFFPLGGSERERSPRIRRDYPEIASSGPFRSLPALRAHARAHSTWEDPLPEFDGTNRSAPYALPTPTSSSSSVLENAENDYEDFTTLPQHTWHSHIPAGGRPRSSAARRLRNLRRSMLRESEAVSPEVHGEPSSSALGMESMDPIPPPETIFVYDDGNLSLEPRHSEPHQSTAREDGDRTPTQPQRLATPPEEVII